MLRQRNEPEAIRNIIKQVTESMVNPTVNVEGLAELNDGQFGNPKVIVPEDTVQSRVNDLASQLDFASEKVLVVGVFGESGIGKTTVVRAMYDQYKEKFDSAGFISNVTSTIKEPNGLINLQNQLYDILGTRTEVVSPGYQQIRRKKLLLIIDNVDEEKQLEEMAINHDRFDSGSIIIIITNEESLLNQLKVDSIYTPRPMNKEEVTALFIWHAFGNCSPNEEYSEHVKTMVDFLGYRPHLIVGVARDLHSKGMKLWEQSVKHIAAVDDIIRKELFQYCCLLFPPGFQFWRDDLIHLWMAEGFIMDKHGEKMEDTGILHFNSLVDQGYFSLSGSGMYLDSASSPTNLYTIDANAYYSSDMRMISRSDKMENAIEYLRANGMLLWYTATKLDYFRVEDPDMSRPLESTRHLSLTFEEVDETYLGIVEKLRELRTLVLLPGIESSLMHVPRTLFWSLNFLRTLKLCDTLIYELPSSIGNVKELRYLDVSGTPITRLPYSVTDLHNLQTLRLIGCTQFSQLPEDLAKLIKLRHIEINIKPLLDSMPPYMGNLTHLQTLSAFVVGEDDGCCIGQLKNLNDLKGAFCISRLENVMDVEEAKEASLGQKWLDKLELQWSDVSSTNKEKQEDILEFLEPHYGLHELEIQCYGGSKLPAWISNPSFACLVVVFLTKCKNCKLLPSMGQLPALKELYITEMNEVTYINNQFFRNGKVNQKFCAFPKLETLEIDGMLNLKEWTEVQEGDMLSLLSLTVSSCPELVTLPSLSGRKFLKNVELRNCPKLRPSSRSSQLPDSLKKLTIVDCSQITEWFVRLEMDKWCPKDLTLWLDDEEIKLKD